MHLYCDYDTAVHIFQAGKGWDPFFESCARQLCLSCVSHDIILAVGYIPDEFLTSSANALSRWHMDQQFNDRVNCLIQDHGVMIINMSPQAFVLSPLL